jgi:hypothetical protein
LLVMRFLPTHPPVLTHRLALSISRSHALSGGGGAMQATDVRVTFYIDSWRLMTPYAR